MNQQPKPSANHNINTNTTNEVASWNRQRTSAELANFVLRKLAALETVSIDE